jgi:NAD-dependent dihydropyrimidine dehydrogenase PreA subunit
MSETVQSILGRWLVTAAASRVSGRRQRLLSLIDSLGGARNLQLSRYGAFARVTIDHRCLGCNVCEAVCPTAAIRRSVEAGGVLVVVRDDQCVACGSCQDACLTGSIRLDPAMTLSRDARTAAFVTGGRCDQCDGFATGNGTCFFCRSHGRLRGLPAARRAPARG